MRRPRTTALTRLGVRRLASATDIKRAVHAGKTESYEYLVPARFIDDSAAPSNGEIVLHQLALAVAAMRSGMLPDALLHYGMGVSFVDKGVEARAQGAAYVAFNTLVRVPLEKILMKVVVANLGSPSGSSPSRRRKRAR